MTVFLFVCGSFGIVHVNPWAEQNKEQAKNQIEKDKRICRWREKMRSGSSQTKSVLIAAHFSFISIDRRTLEAPRGSWLGSYCWQTYMPSAYGPNPYDAWHSHGDHADARRSHAS